MPKPVLWNELRVRGPSATLKETSESRRLQKVAAIPVNNELSGAAAKPCGTTDS